MSSRSKSSEKPERRERSAESSSQSGDLTDVWALAGKERDAAKALAEDERTLLFLGSKGAGKTTLIDSFLEKAPEQPKPSTALEYRYSRKAKGLDQARDVVHIWELAGGVANAKLIDAVLTPLTLRSIAFVFVVDLGAPRDMWPSLDTLFKAVRARIDKVAGDMAAKDPKITQQLKKKAWQKYGDDHPDKEWLTPLPAPLILVGAKYDQFQALDGERRRLICNALRFAAHTNGASLIFTSEKDETLLSRVRGILTYLAFRTAAPSRVVAVEPTKPLVVPVGTDSLSQIGTPPLPTGDVSSLSAKRPHELWGSVLAAAFPPEAAPKDSSDPAANPKYAEAAIDAMRAQKDEELEKYRREAERRARELAQRAQVEEQSAETREGREDRPRGERDKEREGGDRERKERSTESRRAPSARSKR